MKFIVSLLLITSCLSVDYQGKFSQIYDKKYWGSGQVTPSGPGSNSCISIDYLLYMQHMVDKIDIKKVVQIGFGDWNINQHIIFEHKQYFGYDVVESILRPSQFNMKFKIIAALNEITQIGQLLIVRDVMMHWPNSEIEYFTKNILPNFKYALLTNDRSLTPHPDIPVGNWRPLKLDIPNTRIVIDKKYVTDYGTKLKSTYLYTNPNK